jgi:hypothetical protein
MMDTSEMDSQLSGKPHEQRQFGLGGLLWFVVACGAYVSQFQLELFTSSPLGGGWERVGWRAVSTVMVPWLLLAVFYVWIGLRPAFTVHCAGPVLTAIIMTLLLLISQPGGFRDPIRALGMAPVFGCLVSSTVSFPASILMMLVRAFVRTPANTE